MDVLSWSTPDSVLHFQMKILSNLRNVSLRQNSPGSAALSNWWGRHQKYKFGLFLWKRSLRRAGTQEENAESKGNWTIRSLIYLQTVPALFSSHSVKKENCFFKINSSAPTCLLHITTPIYIETLMRMATGLLPPHPPYLCNMTGTESKPGAFLGQVPSLKSSHLDAGGLGRESFPAPWFWRGQVMLE